jgi:hypothetical protein
LASINAPNHFLEPNEAMNIINERIPIKVIAEHRHFFKVLRRAKGYKKLLMCAFLVLTTFNLVYFFVEPAQALLFDDLSGLGRQVGGGITAASYQIVSDIYGSRKYGILGWLSKTCLFFATPIAAVGIMQSLDEKESENPLPKKVFYGVLALVVCLSNGGYIGGQLYLFLYNIFEGFAKQMDDYMSIYSAIEQGKGFLASNAVIAAQSSECHKFTGQEQAKCISAATEHVLGTLGEMASTYGPQDWIKGRIDAISQIGKDIASSDNKIAAIAANGFFLLNQPTTETAGAALATASIAAMSIVYTMTMAFLGLGGPISLLASLLVSGLQAAWVAWVISIFTVWFWHTSYLAVMWFLSKLLISATASTFMATDWFSLLATWCAPVLTGAVCGLSGMSVFQGVTKSATDAATIAIQLAKIAAGAAVGGPAGATTVAMSSGGGSSVPPQNMSTPPVTTQY